jgi:hypothetical protein
MERSHVFALGLATAGIMMTSVALGFSLPSPSLDDGVVPTDATCEHCQVERRRRVHHEGGLAVRHGHR